MLAVYRPARRAQRGARNPREVTELEVLAAKKRSGYTVGMRGPASPQDVETNAARWEWVGKLGAPEPHPYAAMTPAERIELVWPLTVSAWAFSGRPCDESRLRRDVEAFGHRKR